MRLVKGALIGAVLGASVMLFLATACAAGFSVGGYPPIAEDAVRLGVNATVGGAILGAIAWVTFMKRRK